MNPSSLVMFADRLPVEDGQLHVLTAAGLGDLAWVYSKWHAVCAERQVTFWFPQAEMKRAGALAQLYGVRYGYMPDLTTQWVWEQRGEPDIPDSGSILVVHANRHLEVGKRIERWYEELPFRVPKPALNTALYKTEVGSPRYVVAFMCHTGYMEGNLLPGLWARIFREIEQHIAPVLIVAADKDVEFAEKVLEVFDPTFAPVFNGALDQVLAAVQGAQAMVGVASGLTILSTYLGVPTLHAYPRWLKRMPGTWEHAEAVWDACFVDELPFGIGERLERLLGRTGVSAGSDGSGALGHGGASVDAAALRLRLPPDCGVGDARRNGDTGLPVGAAGEAGHV